MRIENTAGLIKKDRFQAVDGWIALVCLRPDCMKSSSSASAHTA